MRPGSDRDRRSKWPLVRARVRRPVVDNLCGVSPESLLRKGMTDKTRVAERQRGCASNRSRAGTRLADRSSTSLLAQQVLS
jgi:hypothetical protein